LVKWRFDDNRL